MHCPRRPDGTVLRLRAGCGRSLAAGALVGWLSPVGPVHSAPWNLEVRCLREESLVLGSMHLEVAGPQGLVLVWKHTPGIPILRGRGREVYH